METREDYINYQERFTNGIKGIRFICSGINSECEECKDIYGYEDSEKFSMDIDSQLVLDDGCFSNSQCDICGSTIGGDRFIAHGLDVDEKVIHLEICSYCRYYNEYGTLDDETMNIIIENEEEEDSVNETYHDLKMLIKEYFEDFYGRATNENGFLEDDVNEAIWWYCCNHHNGQYSDLYGVLSIIDFRPSMFAYKPSEGSATEFYDFLIRNYEEEKK